MLTSCAPTTRTTTSNGSGAPGELADQLGVSLFETALAYVTSLGFPAIALCGAATPDEVAAACRAAAIELTPDQCAWLDLRRDAAPTR